MRPVRNATGTAFASGCPHTRVPACLSPAACPRALTLAPPPRPPTLLPSHAQDAKDKLLRLTADFDNFRKRSGAEKDSLRDAVRGDTVMALVPLVDNFELAKSQLRPETEGERKIDAAYQGLYKQMVELFRGLGLEAVPGRWPGSGWGLRVLCTGVESGTLQHAAGKPATVVSCPLPSPHARPPPTHPPTHPPTNPPTRPPTHPRHASRCWVAV